MPANIVQVRECIANIVTSAADARGSRRASAIHTATGLSFKAGARHGATMSVAAECGTDGAVAAATDRIFTRAAEIVRTNGAVGTISSIFGARGDKYVVTAVSIGAKSPGTNDAFIELVLRGDGGGTADTVSDEPAVTATVRYIFPRVTSKDAASILTDRGDDDRYCGRSGWLATGLAVRNRADAS